MARLVASIALIFLLQSFIAHQKVDIADQQTSVKDRIIGIWAAVGEGNANFEIKKTTIYYPDSFKSYKYIIVHDSLKIIYYDFENASLISFKGNDTLVLTGEKQSVFVRFNK